MDNDAFPCSIRSRLPVLCTEAIQQFLQAKDAGKPSYPPTATTQQELEIHTLLSSLSLVHGAFTLASRCCTVKNQEMNFLIHHVATIWNAVFNTLEGFELKW